MILKRRKFLALGGGSLMAMPISALLAAPKKEAVSTRKGWAGADADLHKEFGAHWYYNWTPNTGDSRVEFVPMIKGAWNVNDGDFGKIGGYRKTTAVLGFNEPERKDQGNVTVAEAIEMWPRLEKLAKKEKLLLGSPAPSSDDKGMAWFGEFMKQVEEKKLHVDFIAMHWYRSRSVDQFKGFLDGLAQKHQRKVWLTEFNGGPSGELADHQKFLEGALKFLEESASIERYAFFNPNAGDKYSLCEKGGKPTVMGEMYKAAGAAK